MPTNNKITLFYILLFTSLLMYACNKPDNALIINKSKETIKVKAITSSFFYTINETRIITPDTTQTDHIEFHLKPNESLNCGHINKNLADEIPFEKLTIIKNNKTIEAKNKDEVLNLFEKNAFGIAKSPYSIVIK